MSDNQRSMPDTSPGRPDDFSAYFDFDKASASASAPQEQRDSNIDGGASGSAVEEPVEVRLYRGMQQFFAEADRLERGFPPSGDPYDPEKIDLEQLGVTTDKEATAPGPSASSALPAEEPTASPSVGNIASGQAVATKGAQSKVVGAQVAPPQPVARQNMLVGDENRAPANRAALSLATAPVCGSMIQRTGVSANTAFHNTAGTPKVPNAPKKTIPAKRQLANQDFPGSPQSTPTLQARFRTGVQTQGLPGTGNFSFHGSGPNVQAGNNRGFNLPVPPFKFPEFQARPAQNFRPPGARLGALPMDMREATAATRVPDGRGGYHPTARWLGANVPKAPPRRYDPMEAALADFDNGRQAGSGARAPRAQTPSLEARGRGHIPTSSAALNPFHQQDQAGFASMTRLANANAGRGSSRAYVPDFNSAENQGFQRRVVSGPGNSSAGNLGNFDPLSRTDRYGSTAGNMRGPQITENVAVPGAGFGSFYPITTSSAFNAPSRALSSAGEFGPFNGSRTHGNLGFGSSGVEGMGAGNSGVGGMRNMPSSSGQTTRKSRYLGGPSQSSRPEGYPSHFPAPGSLGNMAPEYLPAGYIRDPHGIYGEQCSRPLQWLIDRDPSYLEAWEIVNSGRPLTGRIVQENVHPGVLLGLNMPGTYPGGGIGNQNLNAPRPGNVEGSQRQSTPHAGGPFDIGAPGNVAGSDQTTFQEIKMTRRELEECVANTALGAELDDFFETERLAKLQYYTDELQECVDAAKKDDPEKSGGDGNDDGRAEALQTCIDLIQDVPTKKSGGDGTAGGN